MYYIPVGILGSLSGFGGWFLFFINPPNSNVRRKIYVSILGIDKLSVYEK